MDQSLGVHKPLLPVRMALHELLAVVGVVLLDPKTNFYISLGGDLLCGCVRKVLELLNVHALPLEPHVIPGEMRTPLVGDVERAPVGIIG